MRAELLVVDDDAGHLSMLRTVLAGWGYGVTGATETTRISDRPGAKAPTST